MTTKVELGMLDGDPAASLRRLFVGTTQNFIAVPSDPCWLPLFGQTISRITNPEYQPLFDFCGVVAATMVLPDDRGRVEAGLDNMGGTSANRLTNQAGGLNGDVLNATGGAETHQLTVAQLASHPHAVTGATTLDGGHSNSSQISSGTGGSRILGGGSTPIGTDVTSIAATPDHAHSVSGTAAAAGGDQAHNNVQPTTIRFRCVLAY